MVVDVVKYLCRSKFFRFSANFVGFRDPPCNGWLLWFLDLFAQKNILVESLCRKTNNMKEKTEEEEFLECFLLESNNVRRSVYLSRFFDWELFLLVFLLNLDRLFRSNFFLFLVCRKLKGMSEEGSAKVMSHCVRLDVSAITVSKFQIQFKVEVALNSVCFTSCF